MEQKTRHKVKVVPRHEKAKPLDIDSPNIPQWKQHLNQIVADLTVYRIKLRISQAELARRINTTQSVIARFERQGRIPTFEFIYKVAKGLGAELKPLQIRTSKQDQKTCSSQWVPVGKYLTEKTFSDNAVANRIIWNPEITTVFAGISERDLKLMDYLERENHPVIANKPEYAFTTKDKSFIVVNESCVVSNLNNRVQTSDQNLHKAS